MKKTQYYSVYGHKKTKVISAVISAAAFLFGIIIPAVPLPSSDVNASSSEFVGSGFTYDWETVNIGAGGFVTGISFSDDGNLTVSTDVHGAYYYDGGLMRQLTTTETMPSSYTAPEIGGGVFAVVPAPSDSTRVYMYWQNRIFASTNSGNTFTETPFGPFTAAANNNFRTIPDKLAVDPINPDVLYVGTPSDGLYVTYDGGLNFSQVASVPVAASQRGITAITFDRSSGITGGRTNTIYASSDGNGLYQSTDAGANWSAVVSSPSFVPDMEIRSDGGLYAVDYTANTVRYYDGATWTDIQPDYSGAVNGGVSDWSVAVDPTNDDRLYVINEAGSMTRTLDGGATWASGSPSRTATDIPWLAWAGEPWFSTAEIEINPNNPNELWLAQGLGVWRLDISSNPTGTHNWESVNGGIEELVAKDIVSIEGNPNLILSSMDRPIFVTDDITTFPTRHYPDTQFNNGWDLDYSYFDNDYIVGLVSDYFANRGPLNTVYSSDGGATWNSFPVQPGPNPSDTGGNYWGSGGNIAVSGVGNVVVVPSNNQTAYYTTNGGVSWAAVTGLPSDLFNSTYLDRKIIVADPISEGTFYAFHDANGIYRSTDGGANWSVVGNPATYWTEFNAKLKSVPEQGGHLFFTAGHASAGGTGGNPYDGGNPFFRSTNGGATWSMVSGMTEVYDVGFGATAFGETYPSIYVVGFYNNEYGIWRSYDNAVTWEQIGDYPINSLDRISVISGDMNTVGCVYVGFTGSGWARGCERVSGSNNAPTITSNGGGATADINVQENQTAVTTVTATDADAGDTLAYSISGGDDQAAFTITSGGVLSFSIAPDFESPTDIGDSAGNNTYVVEVTVSDDASPTLGTDVQLITVTVTNDSGDDPSSDADSVDDGVEQAAPNSGDFNGDGTADSTQSNVVTSANTNISGINANNPNHYVGLVSESGTMVSAFTLVAAPSMDTGYTYPLGMFSFTATATAPGATDSFTLLLDKEYPEVERDTWVWRKFNGTSYVNVPTTANLTYGTVNLGSFSVTSVTYELTDGGALDSDGSANGVIVDPIGPSVLSDSDQAAEDTDTTGSENLASTGQGVVIRIIVAVTLIVTVLLLTKVNNKVYVLKK